MRVLLTGGEPFLRPDISQLLEELLKNNIQIAIATNGTIYNSDVFKNLRNHKDMVHYIQVSLDGHCAEVNDLTRGKESFEKTVQTIKTLREYNIKVVCRVTIHKKNYTYIRDIYYFLKEQLNIENISFNEVQYRGYAQHDNSLFLNKYERMQLYRIFLDLMSNSDNKIKIRDCEVRSMLSLKRINESKLIGGKLRGCAIVFGRLHILSNGDIVPCDIMKDFVIGNIKTVPDLLYLWKNSPILNMIRERHTVSLDNFTKCNNCNYKHICTGSCPYDDYLTTRTLLSNSNTTCYKDIYNEYKEVL
jgi:SynChlorMet cassette radical SAM/SPASM protein ScmE